MSLLSKTLILLSSWMLLSSCTEQQVNSEFSRTDASAFSGEQPPAKWSSTSKFPLNLRPSTDFTSTELAAISSSADKWDEAVDDRINFFTTSNTLSESSKSSLTSYNDNKFGVYKLYSWPSELPTTALAVTQIFGSNTGSNIIISHADIMFNYDYFSFSTDGSFGYDFETVMLHEMGHFIGLYHDESSISSSVMYPTVSRYITNRTPKQNDINAITAKYLSSSGSRSEQSSSTQAGEDVQIIFEIHADGSEVVKINGKVVKQEKCNHSHTTFAK